MFHFKPLRSAVCAALCLLALGARPAHADLIYDGGLPGPIANIGVDAWNIQHWIIAEDFVVVAPTQLDGVHFWAVPQSATLSDSFAGSIAWVIYANNAGVPGSALNSGTASSTPVAYPGANCCNGFTGYEFDFLLPNISLASGTYWLGLHNGALSNTGGSPIYWVTTNASPGQVAMRDFGPAYAGEWEAISNVNYPDVPQHLAFQVYGTAVAAIPEPETYAMLLAGLGLLGFFARRRNQKAA